MADDKTDKTNCKKTATNCTNQLVECNKGQKISVKIQCTRQYYFGTEQCNKVQYPSREEYDERYTYKHECIRGRYPDKEMVWYGAWCDTECKQQQCIRRALDLSMKDCRYDQCKRVQYKKWYNQAGLKWQDVVKECRDSECKIEYNYQCRRKECRTINKECHDTQCKGSWKECRDIECTTRTGECGLYQCKTIAKECEYHECRGVSTDHKENGVIPRTKVDNIAKGREVLAADYNALMTALDKLNEYKKNVDNCGFRDPSQCAAKCQSCQLVVRYNCKDVHVVGDCKYIDDHDTKNCVCQSECNWKPDALTECKNCPWDSTKSKWQYECRQCSTENCRDCKYLVPGLKECSKAECKHDGDCWAKKRVCQSCQKTQCIKGTHTGVEIW